MAMNPHRSLDQTDETVVAAIDSDSRRSEYVIADISTDDAWLSMQADDAPALSAWR